MLTPIRPEDFTNNLFILLKETFESPFRPASAYLDQKKSGLFETLEPLTAEQASHPVTPGGTTIAAHVKHATFYLEVLEGFLFKGMTGKVDWQESWRVQEVTPEQWEALQGELKEVYTRICDELRSLERWGDDEVGDSMAMLVHTAYHLGAIRQMVRLVR